VSAGRTQPRGTPRPASAEPEASPFDAHTAVETLLTRLRASAGATRVSVWVHETSTTMVVPFLAAVAGAGNPLPENARRTRRTTSACWTLPDTATVITSGR
jgi:hypothetical protein